MAEPAITYDMVRANIAAILNMSVDDLTDAHLAYWCQLHPDDANCVWLRAHPQPPLDDRVVIARHYNVPVRSLTDAQIDSYCRDSQLGANQINAVSGYCYEFRNRDAFARQAIAQQVGVAPAALTEPQVRSYCDTHPGTEYCTRTYPTQASGGGSGLATRTRSPAVTALMVVGGVGALAATVALILRARRSAA